MKIALVSDTYIPNINGAAYFTYRLALELTHHGHQVYVLAPSRKPWATVTSKDNITEYGMPSFPIPIYKGFRISPLLISQHAITRALKEIKPDLIHIQNHFMLGKGAVKAARSMHIPVVGTNHFMPENLTHYLHLPGPLEEGINRIMWRQYRDVYDDLEAITTPTQTAVDLLAKHGFARQVTPISCGINLQRFNPSNDGAYLRKRFAIPKSAKALLFVGRLDKEKRIDVVIRAMKLILERQPDTYFIVAGKGKRRKPLEALAKKLDIANRVIFTGFISDEDLPNLYAAADVFVNAGIAELQSIVTMEALATGLPVVAVNAVALPELAQDGRNGYTFPIDGYKTLAQAAIKILEDASLRGAMSRESLAIIQNHDINLSIRKFETIYKDAIDTFSQTSWSIQRYTILKHVALRLAIASAIVLVGGLAASIFVAPNEPAALIYKTKQAISYYTDLTKLR